VAQRVGEEVGEHRGKSLGVDGDVWQVRLDVERERYSSSSAIS
jgi:hypothetical protein